MILASCCYYTNTTIKYKYKEQMIFCYFHHKIVLKRFKPYSRSFFFLSKKKSQILYRFLFSEINVCIINACIYVQKKYMNFGPYAPNFEIDAVDACASLHSTFMI